MTQKSPQSPGASAAYNRVMERVRVGEAQVKSVVNLARTMVIKNKLVGASSVKFAAGSKGQLVLLYPNDGQQYNIHRNALNQLCAKVKFPMRYTSTLEGQGKTWATDLLGYNLEQLYQNIYEGKEERFLHRIVDAELRGFLSKKYNLHLATSSMMEAFIQSCVRSMAMPAEAVSTDVRFSLKAFLPYVYEPVPGEYIALGVEFCNSDFGKGVMSVGSFIWRVNSMGFIALDESLSKVHLGRILEETDIEINTDTYQKEADAVAAAIHNTVDELLSVKTIERLLSVVTKAFSEQVPWPVIQKQLKSVLSTEEVKHVKTLLEDGGVIELPSSGGTTGDSATSWWVASVLSRMADKELNAERRLELQAASGSFLRE